MKLIRYPIIAITLTFVIGIISYKIFDFNILKYTLIILLVSYFFLVIFKAKLYTLRIIILFTFIYFTGAFINILHEKNMMQYEKLEILNSNYITIFGDVGVKNKVSNKQINFELCVDSIWYKDVRINISPKILVIYKYESDLISKLNVGKYFQNGNKIRIDGYFNLPGSSKNSEGLSYRVYLNNLSITGLLYSDIKYRCDLIGQKTNLLSYIDNLKYYLIEKIERNYEPEVSALIKSLILGDRSDISSETSTKFINTGIIHILAISGVHIMILLSILNFFLGRANRYFRFFIILTFLIFFILLTGYTPSVVRASLMAVIWLFIDLLQRKNDMISVIFLSAFIILIINPLEIYKIGFQLSFGAVLSIALIYPNLKILKPNFKNPMLIYIIDSFLITLSVTIGLLPLVVNIYHKISIISLIINLLIIPLAFIIIAIALFSLFVLFILPNIFFLYNGLLSKIVEIFYNIVDLFNINRGFINSNELNLFLILIYFFFVALLLIILNSRFKIITKISSSLMILICIGMIFLYLINSKTNKNIYEVEYKVFDNFELIKLQNDIRSIVYIQNYNPDSDIKQYKSGLNRLSDKIKSIDNEKMKIHLVKNNAYDFSNYLKVLLEKKLKTNVNLIANEKVSYLFNNLRLFKNKTIKIQN